MLDVVDPVLDASFETEVPLLATQLWRAWTEPALLQQWFCPRPWRVSECQLDLRSGGRFFTRMVSPEGDSHDNEGCFLQLEAPHRLVWTSALSAGYRPVNKALATGLDFDVTADVRFISQPQGGCLYRVLVRHATAEACQRHRDIGFPQGWQIALEQLLELKPLL